MTTTLTLPTPAHLAKLVSQARDYARASRSSNTQRAYQSDLRDFAAWCSSQDLAPLPATPETIALYLSDLATRGKKPSTIARRLAAIAQAHKAANHPSPRSTAQVQAVLRGIRRTVGVSTKQARAITPIELQKMVSALPDSAAGVRDRALLLLGFAGAFRRSEIVGLNIGDLEFVDQGMIVKLRKSKTDQEQKGREFGIPFGEKMCPVLAAKEWLTLVDRGAVFRPVSQSGVVSRNRLTAASVAAIVRGAAKRSGVPVKGLSGHSLRAGLTTAALLAGKTVLSVQRQTGHHSIAMVGKYARMDLFADNAVKGVL